ncbi:hypothetical protein A2837_01880 [Candidatus Kaiserbacteria bacterium RIFCSPHIGHO2_01_FULL_46_22]|uniref:Lipid/polyisoprenoid-binding YceI-like domain-containing protein n=1 Tax=Candidatus Kaiserbacteria bacterium RIFCSPHIGHO2_01_FULL_46_22 TaxID=1798475 RepID=A0A1F6BY97_9BACT|nr:MAG: hypothetical protein A2837_01880 [Candidatus Kaiserbacteria bacterium RIFCSPHIGHO2_01_FULL_46_22]
MKNIITLYALFALLPTITLADTTNTSYSEEQAQAYFSSQQGCDDVVVGVSIVETEKTSSNIPPTPTQAFVFGVFNNICDIGSSYSFAEVITLDDSEFEQKKLQDATLNFTKNLSGFDVNVSLEWEGFGKTEKNKNKIHIKDDAIIVHDSDVIASRAAEINGTFSVNGIDYAVGTETGGLSTIRAHTVQIEK